MFLLHSPITQPRPVNSKQVTYIDTSLRVSAGSSNPDWNRRTKKMMMVAKKGPTHCMNTTAGQRRMYRSRFTNKARYCCTHRRLLFKVFSGENDTASGKTL